jgi:hypothetical protein
MTTTKNRDTLTALDKAYKLIQSAACSADGSDLRMGLLEIATEINEYTDGIVATAQLAGDMDEYGVWIR